MDAHLVWNTWRRVLTSDHLVEWIMSPDPGVGEASDLTGDEVAVLIDYAATPMATDTNIGMYRRGLARNALGALDLVPLTRRLLRASGLDIEAVATEFARFSGYVDNGPNFWRTAEGFVAYLTSLPEFASRPQQDVLAIDAATIALARRLGYSGTTVWPDSAAAIYLAAGPRAHRESGRLIANPAAIVVSTNCDLTTWIENPFDFDSGETLESSPRYWLIYFPTAEAAQEYAELSERSARAFNLLWASKTAADLSRALDDLSRADVLTVIASLAELGVVISEPHLLRTTQAVSSLQGNLDRPAESLPVPSGLFSGETTR